ncbi:MAG: YggS family pyridoxal phosphate-dependent enzyme [Vicinamibacteria bacterium]
MMSETTPIGGPHALLDIKENVARVRRRIERAAERCGRDAARIQLLAVTKTVDPRTIAAAIDAGLREFGESYVQEAKEKIPKVSGARCWHLVGHLQRNKASDAVRLFATLHSIDSLSLAEGLARRARAEGRDIDIFTQVNLAGEKTKRGFKADELEDAVEEIRRLSGLRLRGLMAVPPYERDPEEARPYFRRLRNLAERHNLPDLSMGMTHDFEIAIEEGATIVRVGTAIFGPRR